MTVVCYIIIIVYRCDTLGQIAPKIFKEIQRNPSIPNAPIGIRIVIITTQLIATSFQPLFSLSILSIIVLTFCCCLLCFKYTILIGVCQGVS
jgi:hypothetical protein